MKPKIDLPIEAFNAAFREYAKVTSRGIAEDLNQKSYDVVNAAFALTKRADRGKIKSIFAPTGKKQVATRIRLVSRRIKSAA